MPVPSKPSVDMRWATDGGTTTAPTTGRRNTGWEAGDEPGAQVFNYMENAAYQWQQWAEDGIDALDAEKAALAGSTFTGNLLPDATSNNRKLGITTQRWDANLDDLNVNTVTLNGTLTAHSDLVPDDTTHNHKLGTTTQRWDANLETVDILTTLTVGTAGTTQVTTDLDGIYPPATGSALALGKTGSRWADVWAVTAHITNTVVAGALDVTTVNSALVPLNTSAQDLGSDSKFWEDGYIETVRYSANANAYADANRVILAHGRFTTNGSGVPSAATSFNNLTSPAKDSGTAGRYTVDIINDVPNTNVSICVNSEDWASPGFASARLVNAGQIEIMFFDPAGAGQYLLNTAFTVIVIGMAA